MSRNRGVPTGTCKLTGARGKYVEAHVIPKALTRSRQPGLPFIQSAHGSRPILRWGGWYDRRPVVRRGEDILAALDTWAVRELRKHELVWSGWGSSQALTKPPTPLANDGRGMREISGTDPTKLRLFFLSLLWRAAVSNREEFLEITMPDEELERLRLMIVTNDPRPLSFYPSTLVQFSTWGAARNLTPQSWVVRTPDENMAMRKVPIFRFYFDGLIAWTYRNTSDSSYAERHAHALVGHGPKLHVAALPYQNWFQSRNMMKGSIAALEQFPEVMNKLLRKV